MDEIKSLGWRDDYNPKYVEVSFSNVNVILNVLIVDGTIFNKMDGRI